MSILGLLIELVVWNQLGGLLLRSIPFGPIVRASRERAAGAGTADAAGAYRRWLATEQLWYSVVTVAGSAVLCWVDREDQGARAWIPWTIFAVYVIAFRLRPTVAGIIGMIRPEDAAPR